MPGVRIDRLLASTAAILLLAGAASIASAEPKFGTAAETATAPAATGAPSGEINRSAKPAEPSSQEPMAAPAAKPQARADHAVVAIVKPEDIRDSSPASASEPAEEKTEQPAAAPAEAAPAEQPAATAADRGAPPNSRQQPPRLPNRLNPQQRRLTRPSPRQQRRPPNRPRPEPLPLRRSPKRRRRNPLLLRPPPAATRCPPPAQLRLPTMRRPRQHGSPRGNARTGRRRCQHADRHAIARARQWQVRPHRRRQEGSAGFRCLLRRPRLRADLDHRRQIQRARRGGNRVSRPGRCRRPRSGRLSGAEHLRVCHRSRCIGGSRNAALRLGRDLRPSCFGRTRALVARQQLHSL